MKPPVSVYISRFRIFFKLFVSRWREVYSFLGISQNFVAYSEYMNFKVIQMQLQNELGPTAVQQYIGNMSKRTRLTELLVG